MIFFLAVCSSIGWFYVSKGANDGAISVFNILGLNSFLLIFFDLVPVFLEASIPAKIQDK